MRTLVKHGLVVLVAAAAACSPKPQAPRDPIGGDPKPQGAFSDPKRQASHDPIGGDPKPQGAFGGDPKPQQSAFGDPAPQPAITDPKPQKPLIPAHQGAPVAQAKRLNDGQILAVSSVADRGELQMAELARKNARSSDVKQFAAMLVTHHRDAAGKGRQVQEKAKVQLEENDVSAQLETESQSAMSTLRTKGGAEFDRLYVDSQVRMHKEVLETIDAKLLPDASNAEVKSHITEMRRNVAAHLAQAEKLQAKLDPAAAAARARDAKDAKAKTEEKEEKKGDTKKTPPDSGQNPVDEKR